MCSCPVDIEASVSPVYSCRTWVHMPGPSRAGGHEIFTGRGACWGWENRGSGVLFLKSALMSRQHPQNCKGFASLQGQALFLPHCLLPCGRAMQRLPSPALPAFPREWQNGGSLQTSIFIRSTRAALTAPTTAGNHPASPGPGAALRLP